MGQDECGEKIRVLLVDDEEEFLAATSRALARRGFTATSAADGGRALALLAAQSFDVVVLDVKMPGIDGVDVFREIKRAYPALPVILLTGHGTIEQAFETSREGVFEYLSKPCAIDQLVETARAAVAQVGQPGTTPAEEWTEEIRVLLVDDEEDLLGAMAAALGRRGMRVSTARSGDEALRLAHAQLFDVAVVDMKMPGMDGLSVVRRIKAGAPLLEAILLTGFPTMNTGVDAMREGAFDCLAKPQHPDALAARIRDAYLLRKQRAEEQRQQELDELASGKAR